ncbi:hypothetical protein AT864_03075 [Anoxybacillus sp. P3H1B]|uniref:DUF4177 domain-containing protein n=1 Tax=Anoxybacillus sp. P3H1B TaxID=1769293 RepID=UPI0007995FF4|nr:DUF4177 domain-containing protein [Anoxybacillus sp. P3H1B]KXG08658.1 hypothetical protein AT864_03075 [Anoxybacillus sp. P3H1B]
MKKFEYKIVRYKIEKGLFDKEPDPDNILNEMGAQGWELVNVITNGLGGVSGASDTLYFIFKREKQ